MIQCIISYRTQHTAAYGKESTVDSSIRGMPKYELLAAKVARQIESGAFAPGQPVPSIRSLMSEHNLSMGTVVKGLDLLQRQGMVECHPQRGYFVAYRSPSGPLTRQIAFITQALSGDTNLYLASFSQALDHQQYSVATYSSANDQSRYQAILEQAVNQRPAGIILYSHLPSDLCPIDPGILAEAGIPVAVIGQAPDGLVCDRVCQDSRTAARKLARHLMVRGCREFAMLIYRCDMFATQLLSALRFELASAGQTLPDERVYLVESVHGFTGLPDPYIDAQLAVEKLIAGGVPFRTLVCCHDYPAVGAIRALTAAGVNVPGDVAVASGGSCSVQGILPIALTTLDHHREEQAQLAAELLLRRIDGYDGPPEVHYVQGNLIPGETS